MTQLLEFIGNHPLLIGALAAVIFMMLASEMRRKLVGAKPVSTKEMIALMNNQNAKVFDLRKADDYKAGHIIGSINVTADNINENDVVNKDKSQPIVLVCQTGSQSQQACAALKKLGFSTLHYLKGGILTWTQDNLPLEKQ